MTSTGGRAAVSAHGPPHEGSGRAALAIVFALVIATFTGLLAIHRDLALILGNPEWDYVAQIHTRGEGVLERSTSLVDALRPDGRYGQGYALATWAMRSALALAGIEVDAFRAAQLVTVVFSILYLVAGLRLARAFGVRAEREWLAVAALAGTWPFLSLAVQVTTDVPTGALLALAAAYLFRPLSRRSAAATGALLGVAFLFRQSALVYLPLYAAVAIVAPAGAAPAADRVRAAAAMCLGFALLAAPRVLADLLQTGTLIHHDHGPMLRALLYEGGLEAFRPEPISVFEIIGRDPARFLAITASSFWFYARWLLAILAPALVVLFHGKETRQRARIALLLIAGMLLGPAAVPTPAIRYILAAFPITVAAALAALERGVPRAAPRLMAALGVGWGVVFGIETVLLVDKYRPAFPEAEIRAALDAGPRGPVLVRPGVDHDRMIYFFAIRYRLRRVGAHLVPAFDALDAAEVARRGLTAPFYVLRVAIRKTGPRILPALAAGRPREVFRPAEDPCLASGTAVRLGGDSAAEVELWRVDSVAAGGASANQSHAPARLAAGQCCLATPSRRPSMSDALRREFNRAGSDLRKPATLNESLPAGRHLPVQRLHRDRGAGRPPARCPPLTSTPPTWYDAVAMIAVRPDVP